MKTVHLILNAHIDHVWLWPWPRGVDAALNTCRSVAARLEARPEATFCRGDAWLYSQIERLDPALFARVRGLVAAGRWHPVGGAWVQPDLNQPTAEGLAAQLRLGLSYFASRLGVRPRAAFNVDAFGHPASLPRILRAAGLDRAVMMRPQEHEMALPARLFRWRGEPGGPEVLAFRVARAYATFGAGLRDHVLASLEGLPEGVEHTMAFVGAGDHGGGPTAAQIDWCLENAEAIEGTRLVFSWPDRFFDAVEAEAGRLPLVTGELQPHAVGCYSVGRAIKGAVRRAEALLTRAAAAGASTESLEPAWRDVCFAQFHDTLAGTAVASAYPQVLDRVGRAAALADELLEEELRRRALALPPAAVERIVLWNPGPAAFDGPFVHEQVLLEERRPWDPAARLVDGKGAPIPTQLVAPEALVPADAVQGLLFDLHLDPGEIRAIRIDRSPGPAAAPPAAQARVEVGAKLAAGDLAVDLLGGPAGRASFGGVRLPLPRLVLLADASDTWSHGVDRYGVDGSPSPAWGPPRALDQGPIRATLARQGTLGQSRVVEEVRLHAGRRFVEILLRVAWAEEHRVLKLVVEPGEPIVRRLDGIPGGILERPADCDERPVRDLTLLELEGGSRLGVACPDVYGIDGTPERVRLTLLRSPLLAHHDPAPPDLLRGRLADRGEHLFRLRLLLGADLEPAELESEVAAMTAPPLVAATTRGMEALVGRVEG